jgi:hypothetical protein
VIITWNFGGQITSSTAPTFLPPVGTNFTGSVTFNTVPTGTVSPDGTHADWDNATITSFNLDGPASKWNNMVLPNTSGTITVDNGAALDQLVFRTLEGEFVVTLTFQQHGSNPDALSSVSPPSSPPLLSKFDVATFSIVDHDLNGGPPGPGGRSSGVITSLTGPRRCRCGPLWTMVGQLLQRFRGGSG